MRLNQFLFFTVFAILGQSLPAMAGSPICEVVFTRPPQVSHSIATPLTVLRDSLSELNQNLTKIPQDGKTLNPFKGLTQDPRELAYLLQGSYRLLISHPQAREILSKKQFQKLEMALADMKWLEKKLGQQQNAKDLVKAARKADLPSDFISHLELERDTTSQSIFAKLRKKHFLSDELSTVDLLLQELKGMKKLDDRVTNDYLQKSLQSEIARVHEKVELEMKPLILKNRYGYFELEDGAHAFRRSLRWLKVYVQAYKDHFSLELKTGQLNAKEIALREKYGMSKDLRLSLDGPIRLKEMEYYQLLEFISELRKIKGVGETQELLTEQLQSYGKWYDQSISADAAKLEIARRMETKLQDIEIRAQNILAAYESLQAFKNLVIEGAP